MKAHEILLPFITEIHTWFGEIRWTFTPPFILFFRHLSDRNPVLPLAIRQKLHLRISMSPITGLDWTGADSNWEKWQKFREPPKFYTKLPKLSSHRGRSSTKYSTCTTVNGVVSFRSEVCQFRATSSSWRFLSSWSAEVDACFLVLVAPEVLDLCGSQKISVPVSF